MTKQTTETVKPVSLTDNDTSEKYELDFNRDAVKFAESRGFKVSEISDYPATRIPELFWYAFRKNHKRMTQKQTDAILEKMGGAPAALISRLVELYLQAGYTGVVNAEDEETKNSVVTVEL